MSENVQAATLLLEKTGHSLCLNPNATSIPKPKWRSFWEDSSAVNEAKADAHKTNSESIESKKYRPDMFGEMKTYSDTNGKIMHGAPNLIRSQTASYFPSLECDNLSSQKCNLQEIVKRGRISILLTNFKNSGLEMIPGWLDVTLESKDMGNDVLVMNLSIIEEWYLKMLRKSIVKGLRKSLPEKLHANSYYTFGWRDTFRTELKMFNSFVCYVHLIDKRGRIRWMTAGPVTEEEGIILQRLYKQLCDEDVDEVEPAKLKKH